MDFVLVSLNGECCTAQPTAQPVYRSPLISSVTKLNGCCKKLWLATLKKISKLSPTSRTKYGTIPLSSRERFPDVEQDDRRIMALMLLCEIPTEFNEPEICHC
jgi:hypothetical protein